MLQNYITIAWRNLIKNKSYSLINLAGLGVGLACVALIILYINDELSYDRFHEKGNRIHRVVRDVRGAEGKEEKAGNTGGIHGEAFKQEIPEIEAFCRFNGGGQALIKSGKNVFSEGMMFADTNFFQIFSFKLIQGNPATAFRGINSVVITKDVAIKYFGSENALGKTLEIHQEGKFQAFTVTGVSENNPANSGIQYKFLLPIERTLIQSWTKEWSNAFLSTFVVLMPEANPGKTEAKMAKVVEKYMGERLAEERKHAPQSYLKFKLQPFFNIHLDADYIASNGLEGGSKVDYSYILGGIAVFILVIACINFINLALARSLSRGKEIGIRKVTGGTRKQLVLQFLSESFLITLFAFVLALVIVAVSLPFFNELSNKKLALSYLFQPQIVGFFLLLILANTILSGLYPALVVSGFNPVKALSGPFKLSGRNYFGQGLVVIQFVLAIGLIIATIIMQRQFDYLINKDLGFKSEGMVRLDLPMGDTHLAPFKSELQKHPSIQDLTAYSGSFLNWLSMQVKVQGKEVPGIPTIRIDQNWLPALKIRLIAGRNFSGTAADTAYCLLNQSLANSSEFKNPIGKKISINGRTLTIIGVTKDFNFTTLKKTIEPLIMTAIPDLGYSHLMIKIDPKQKVEAIKAIQEVHKTLFPIYPCNYNFLEDDLAEQYEAESRWKKIIGIASTLTIFISCIGLFGLASLSIRQRTKEIGVRKVLGAGVVHIVESVSAKFLRLVIIAAIIASPVAWYFTEMWLQNFPYRTSLNIWLFIACGLSSLGFAFFTISFQTVKAALANPVKSLRAE